MGRPEGPRGTSGSKRTRTKRLRSHLADVADDDLADGDLVALAAPDHGEFVLALDAVLQAAELALLRVVVERRHQHDDHHRNQNGQSFDPLVRFVLLVADVFCYVFFCKSLVNLN